MKLLNYVISGFLTFAIFYFGLMNNQLSKKVTHVDLSGTWWYYTSYTLGQSPVGFGRKFYIEKNVIYQIMPKDTCPKFGIYAHRTGSNGEIKLSLLENWMDIDEFCIGGVPSRYALTHYSIASLSNQMMVVKGTFFKFKGTLDSFLILDPDVKLKHLFCHHRLDTFYNCKFIEPLKDLYRPSDTSSTKFW